MDESTILHIAIMLYSGHKCRNGRLEDRGKGQIHACHFILDGNATNRKLVADQLREIHEYQREAAA